VFFLPTIVWCTLRHTFAFVRQLLLLLLLRCLQRTHKVQLLLLHSSRCITKRFYAMLAERQAAVGNRCEGADLPIHRPHTIAGIARKPCCKQVLLVCHAHISSCSSIFNQTTVVPADLRYTAAAPQAAWVAGTASHSMLLQILLLPAFTIVNLLPQACSCRC
jgi:hypothetical protein